MAIAFRPKIGLGLQGIVEGDQPKEMAGPFDNAPGMGAQGPKAGFFGDGGMGRYLAGAIGDALLQNAGMQPVFSPMQRDKQRAEQEQAQWGLRNQAERANKQWEWANKPKDTNPHYFETNDGSQGMIGPDGKPQIIYKDPTPKMNFLPDGLGGGQWVAVPGQAPSMPAPQASAELPQGYTVRKAGGAGGNASGGFRR